MCVVHREVAAMRRQWMASVAVSFAVLVAGGCATIPPDALVLSPESLELRQLQTRRIDGIGEKALLNASAGVLQDLGFNIDESETKLGVIVASKDRSAMNAAQVAGAIAVALLGAYMPVDKTQKIRVSLVTRPALASDGSIQPDSQFIRITIQRIVWNTENQVTRIESIEEPLIYQEFFEKLSKSIFLEVQQI
jgi:hypothetical protein